MPPCRHRPVAVGALASLLATALMACSRPEGVGRAADPAPADGERMAFVGDSLTAGGHWQRAFPHLSIANAGVSGDTTVDVLARLPRIQASGARTYFLMVGINDIIGGSPPGAIAPRILSIKKALETAPGRRVYLQSILPCRRSICGERELARVEELNRLLLERTPPGDFLDLRPALSDADGELKASFTDDGLHLNAEGYQRWEALLAPYLGAPGPAGDPERGVQDP